MRAHRETLQMQRQSRGQTQGEGGPLQAMGRGLREINTDISMFQSPEM